MKRNESLKFTVRKIGRSAIRTMAVAAVLAAGVAQAQLSLSTVVDLALKNSPRVKQAQADLERTNAALRQSKDVFIPNLTAGSGLGYTYGFPIGQPTLFSFTSQSTVFDLSQFNYVRAARTSIQASLLAVKDARQQVEAETCEAYIQLDIDVRQQAILGEQVAAAQRLGEIVQQRLDAGVDSHMDLTRARLTGAQTRLNQVHLEGEVAGLRDHLARLTGLPANSITTDTASIPAAPGASALRSQATPPAVLAAYANAKAKQQAARGDRRQLYLPQFGYAFQYARFASFNDYTAYYTNYQANNMAFGMQLTWPIFDRARVARADASAADARHALYEADQARDVAAEGNLKLLHSITELAAKQDVAALDRELAQEQVDAVTIQMDAGSGDAVAPQTTPKDEQTARIAAGQKSLELLDADYQLRQAQLELLRAGDGLEAWIRSATPAAKP